MIEMIQVEWLQDFHYDGHDRVEGERVEMERHTAEILQRLGFVRIVGGQDGNKMQTDGISKC